MKKKVKAWIVAVDMGLGHQRAVYPLKQIAQKKKLINMQDGCHTSPKETKIWHKTRVLYETISRAGNIPFIGKYVIAAMDKVQYIPPFYPRRDLSAPTRAVQFLDKQITKKNMGKKLVQKMEKKPAPLITSFYAVAIAAEKQRYCHDIYCIICDSDFNRAWLPKYPPGSRIRYFSPCDHVTNRLQMYGVRPDNIFTTGFPLPKSNIGKTEEMLTLRSDVKKRLFRLDPSGTFRKLHKKSMPYYLKKSINTNKTSEPLTVSYAVGGAGAQVDIGMKVIKSLKSKIKDGTVKLNLIAGVRKEIAKDFYASIAQAGLEGKLDNGLQIIHHIEMSKYFRLFNKTLRESDVLWTKPSELTFYAGLGIPIITAPPIGYHERLNYRWLVHKNAALRQEDPEYTHQWLIDFWEKGLLADRAWNGFLKMRKLGAFRIETILKGNDPPFQEDIFSR